MQISRSKCICTERKQVLPCKICGRCISSAKRLPGVPGDAARK